MLQVPEPFAPVAHERLVQRALVVGGERPVRRRRRGRARTTRRRSTRSARNFWCTSVRFTILFVPVVGGSRRMRT